jgi:hypothetical protein
MSGAKQWSKAELKLLICTVVEGGKKIDWSYIATLVNRKARMCRDKWQQICETERVDTRGIWEDVHDKELIRLREKAKMGWYCMSDYLDAEPMWLKSRYQKLRRVQLERPNSVPVPQINRPEPEPISNDSESDDSEYVEKPKTIEPIEEPKPQYGGKRAWYGGKSPRVWE